MARFFFVIYENPFKLTNSIVSIVLLSEAGAAVNLWILRMFALSAAGVSHDPRKRGI